ncbi:MAG: glycosyltransferase family 2 protein [Desulfobacterales bacterium]|nr:glycosyltransferase family 2 protein [Desulfobacterales bacterium]
MVSCIIPTYNRMTMLPGAIESVLGQTLRPEEIIVVDDASDDGTFEMICEKYPSVTLLKTEGVGPGYARNAGFKVSSGNIIMFLDSDDIWLPDHVETLSNIVGGGRNVAYGITETADRFNNTSFMIPENGAGTSGDCFENICKWCFLVPSSAAITRKAFDNVGGFRKYEMGEDWDLFIRLAEKYPFGFSPKIITKRILHSGSICCKKEIHEKILNLLENIKNVLMSFSRTTGDALNFIEAAGIVVKKEGAKWQTFQEFYMALNRQGLI